MPIALEEEALGAMQKGTRDHDLDRTLRPSMPVSWAKFSSSSGVMPETSRVTVSSPFVVRSVHMAIVWR